MISRVMRMEIPIAINRSIDLLFVIDNSPAMAAHQDHLRASADDLMRVLETTAGGLPDVHIGVVTTDLGARGADGSFGSADAASGCEGSGDDGRLRIGRAPVGGAFVSDLQTWDGRQRNYDGALTDVFGQVADVGAAGCVVPQPLEAMRRALDPANGANAGFLRDDAFLVVAFITANDDCSMTTGGSFDGAVDTSRCSAAGATVPIEVYERFLKGLKPDPSKVVVASATGACAAGDATATAAPRLDALLARFPNRSTTTPLCAPDLTPLLALATQTLKVLLGYPCVEPVLFDRQPEVTGTQPECVSWLEEQAAPARQRILTSCDSEAPTLPCWSLTDDPQNCFATPSGQRMDLLPERRPSFGSVRWIMECVVDPGS